MVPSISICQEIWTHVKGRVSRFDFLDEIVQAAALRERANPVIMIHVVRSGGNACKSGFSGSPGFQVNAQLFHPFDLQSAP